MKKSKMLVGLLALGLMMILVAGCGSSEKPAAQAPAAQPAASGHAAHSAAMPKEDPMPFMKDMDKALQDVLKQVKAGQTMDAQKNAALLVSTANKVTPHMMDDALKENLRKAAIDIKDTVNSGKTDLGVLEGKVQTMQELMKQTTAHLQTMSH